MIHNFKMKIKLILLQICLIIMGPDFISLELLKIISCVDQIPNKIKQEEVQVGPTQNCLKKKHGAQFGILGPSRGKVVIR